MSERDPALQELLDHRAISQLSIDYMRALDRLDGELLRSVYHPDATDDRGFFAGSGPEFCDFALGVLASHKTNHHMLGQMNIAIEGDKTGEGDLSEGGLELHLGEVELVGQLRI